jgi:glycosyltransferase involved in cell wall biosynthesis
VTLDIVIPAHNEERRIGRTLRAYTRAFTDRDVRFRVALDGCADNTAGVVLELIREDPRIDLHEFPKLGKGGVLMESFRRCDADLVAFVDADCATPPSELALLADQARNADGAIASRRHPSAVTPGQRPLARRITSAGFATCIRALFRLPYSDTQCGAKVLRREVLDAALPLMSSRDFLFDVDLLHTANQLGFDIVEVPTVWIDQAESKLSATTDARRMLASALRLWVHHQVLPIEARGSRPVTRQDDTDVEQDVESGGGRVAA